MLPIPQQAIKLIKQFEGCRLTAYRDIRGILTIGYGSTTNVTEGMKITQSDADERLVVYLTTLQKALSRLVRYTTNDNQHSALLSFVYNVGSGAFQRSTLRMKLNRGEIDSAAKEFPKYCYAGGRKVAGLLRRRLAEQHLFIS